MRSATVLAFSGLAAAGLIPSYDVPSQVPDYDAPSQVPDYEAPSQETEYSTQWVTVTSCEPDASTACPAESTVVYSSEIPLTTSTIYETRVHTVTDCPEEVTDCPASETPIIVTETIAISTTVCPVSEEYPEPTPDYSKPVYPPVEEPSKTYPPVEESETPEYPEEEPSKTYPPVESEKPSGGKPYPPPTEETEKPYPPPGDEEELCPTESVKTIVYSTEITTVIPTVLTKYETATLEVPCPEPTKPSASIPVPPQPPVPSNGTSVYPPPGEPSGPAEAGAAGVSGSMILAAAAALAAYAFA